MALNLTMTSQNEELKPRITVFGVGGAGGNAVNNMIASGLSGVEFAGRLLDEEHVAVMPGESFGSGGAGHVRVALTVESELLKEASIRIRRLADTCLTERK